VGDQSFIHDFLNRRDCDSDLQMNICNVVANARTLNLTNSSLSAECGNPVAPDWEDEEELMEAEVTPLLPVETAKVGQDTPEETLDEEKDASILVDDPGGNQQGVDTTNEEEGASMAEEGTTSVPEETPHGEGENDEDVLLQEEEGGEPLTTTTSGTLQVGGTSQQVFEEEEEEEDFVMPELWSGTGNDGGMDAGSDNEAVLLETNEMQSLSESWSEISKATIRSMGTVVDATKRAFDPKHPKFATHATVAGGVVLGVGALTAWALTRPPPPARKTSERPTAKASLPQTITSGPPLTQGV